MHVTSMKHIKTRMLYVRELVTSGRFFFTHIPGKDQPADLLTKPLAADLLTHLRRAMLTWGGEFCHRSGDDDGDHDTSALLDRPVKRPRLF